MKIYKYLDANGLTETLKNNTLKFSQPWVFNDPYDTHIPAKCQRNETEVFDLIDECISSYLDNNWKPLPNNRFQKDLHEYLSHNSKRIELLMKDRVQFINNLINNTKDGNAFDFIFETSKPSETNIVCCFSQTKDSLLMWSHYAEKHKGAVLEFEVNELSADEKYHMEYTNKIPCIDLNKILFENDSSDMSKYLSANYYYKANCWQYEQEIRFLYYVKDDGDNNLVSRNVSEECLKSVRDCGYCYVPFSIKSLKSIYLGVKYSSNKEDTMNFYKKYPFAQIYKARLKTDCFGLDFELTRDRIK